MNNIHPEMRGLKMQSKLKIYQKEVNIASTYLLRDPYLSSESELINLLRNAYYIVDL